MSLYSIGAADLMVTAYRKAADEMSARSDAVPHGVLAFKKNNLLPDVFHYPSGDGATAKYDELADAPGEYVYIYLYRDSKPVDEAYFTATSSHETKFETKTETRKERVGLGWILGGVGIALLGMSMFKKRS